MRRKIFRGVLAVLFVALLCTGCSSSSNDKSDVTGALADATLDAESTADLVPDSTEGPGEDVANANEVAEEIGDEPADVTVDTQQPSAGWCPVEGYAACGGDLTGTWKFLALCPEDAQAAADLCESPFDDKAECVGGGNINDCKGFHEGTLTFDGNGQVAFETELWMAMTWVYTDACLAAAGVAGGTPEERCLGLSSDKLTCNYLPDECTCSAETGKEFDSGDAAYSLAGDELVIGEDPPATFCIEDDLLIMDYYLFHPVSWRYWVLQRVTQ